MLIKKTYAYLMAVTFAASLWIGNPQAANAITIEYQATHATGNTWQYDYYVSGFAFPANYTFGISFNYANYLNLQNPVVSPAPALWDVLSTEPDANLLSPGWYFGTALVNNPSTTLPFTITFDWLGIGSPGSQPFEIYDDAFATIASGNTTLRQTDTSPPPVPNPGTLYLFLAALIPFLFIRKKRPC
jgi:hypothetical protein